MSEFLHAVVRTRGEPPAEVVPALRAAGPWLALAGGPGIGWASDEFPVIVTDEGGMGQLAGDRGWALEGSRRFTPTVRPIGAGRPDLAGGVVALRRFEVGASDADEFVELSAAAWPTFEDLYQAEVLGLFVHAGDDGRDFLLATWYGSLAEWERSREAVAAEQGDAAEAGRRFLRRRQITRRTVVRVGVPL